MGQLGIGDASTLKMLAGTHGHPLAMGGDELAGIMAATAGAHFNDSSMPDKGKKGRKPKESQGEREADQRTQGLIDKVRELAQAYRLMGNDSDVAAAKDELLYGEYASDAAKARGLAIALHAVSQAQKDAAAESLFGKKFSALKGDDKYKAEVLALTKLEAGHKAAAEKAKEYLQIVKDLHSELGLARLKANYTSPLDEAALDSPFHTLFRNIKDKKAAGIIRAQVQLDERKRLAEVNLNGFDNGSDAAAKYLDEKNKAAGSVDMLEVSQKWDTGLEFIKRNLEHYAGAMKGLTAEVLKYSKATDAARLDAIMFDDAGQRMSLHQAQQVLTMQKYVEKLKAWHEEMHGLASSAAGVVSGTVQHILEHGPKGAATNFSQGLKKMAEDILLTKLDSGIQSWIEGRLTSKGGPKKSADVISATDLNTASTDRNTKALEDLLHFYESVYGGGGGSASTASTVLNQNLVSSGSLSGGGRASGASASMPPGSAGAILNQVLGPQMGGLASKVLSFFPNALAFGGGGGGGMGNLTADGFPAYASGGHWDGRAPIRVHAGELLLPSTGHAMTVLTKAETSKVDSAVMGGRTVVNHITQNIRTPDVGSFREDSRAIARRLRGAMSH
jgi:hypothetical protein